MKNLVNVNGEMVKKVVENDTLMKAIFDKVSMIPWKLAGRVNMSFDIKPIETQIEGYDDTMKSVIVDKSGVQRITISIPKYQLSGSNDNGVSCTESIIIKVEIAGLYRIRETYSVPEKTVVRYDDHPMIGRKATTSDGVNVSFELEDLSASGVKNMLADLLTVVKSTMNWNDCEDEEVRKKQSKPEPESAVDPNNSSK